MGRRVALCVSTLLAASATARGEGVWVRFRLEEPAGTRYHVRLGGYIHRDPWTLPGAVVPPGADRDASLRVPTGEATPWFDLGAHAGKLLHGRLNRSGGVAELPNITADLVVDSPAERRRVIIEVATGPEDRLVARRLEESFAGSLTSFLVSPDLARDAGSLETASEMARRRLGWAREASGGRRTAPRELIVQTGFWAPQRPELNLQEAETLHLLGFNVVGNQSPEVLERRLFRAPGHTHDVDFGPAATRAGIDQSLRRQAERVRGEPDPGAPFNFSDEICARPPIGANPAALAHFRAWLAARGIRPETLGVPSLDEVVPIEDPEELGRRRARDDRAARRVFYFTSRFRQEAAVERLLWTTESLHRHFPGAWRTSTLVADHPYFSGTGLGMGMAAPNWTWGGWPLAIDWFELGRRKAVDLIGIEDWMGLQYMFGPDSTWEGFQLMGFQAAIFRSASRGTLPTIAWITPSDERNLRLKFASALCQGARHLFFWTYGPTATSTENYWSDLRGAYDGIVKVARQLAEAEPILLDGAPRKARVALLYSISSDLWQPFDQVHLLERRGLWFSLVHDQYLVDMITEEDIEAGRLSEYEVLYTADPCLTGRSAATIDAWVRAGGSAFASCAAGSRNEFGEPSSALAAAFGIEPAVSVTPQAGRYSVRAGVNDIPYTDELATTDGGPWAEGLRIGVIGAKVSAQPASGATAIARFRDGSPAAVANVHGSGRTVHVGACPGIAYFKEARFVRDRLAETWPADLRAAINAVARESGVPRLVELSAPVVEAGVYDAPSGTALVLANFTYRPVDALEVRLPLPARPRRARSVERGDLEIEVRERPGDAAFPWVASFRLALGTSDIVCLER